MNATPLGARKVNRTATLLGALTIVSLSRVPNAHAQANTKTPNPTPSGSTLNESERARDFMRRGFAAFDRNDYESARSLLSEAWALRKSYDVAAALGQCEIELHRYRDAAEHLDYALHNFAPKDKAALEAQVQDGLTQAKKYVATIELVVSPQGAQVRLDGTAISPSPRQVIYVDAGAHVFEASLGTTADRRELAVAAGSDHRIELRVPSAASAPKASSPPVASAHPPSSRSLHAKPDWIPFVTGGVALAGTATWLGFWAASSGARTDAEKFQNELGPSGCTATGIDQTACNNARDAYDRSRRDATLSRVGLGVAAAGSIATLAYIFLWPSDSSGSATGSMLPIARISQSEASLTLEGKF